MSEKIHFGMMVNEMPGDSSPTMGWHNYRTGETDWLQDAPADYSDYIPQDAAAQNMYHLLVDDMGELPTEACIKVLTACVGGR